VGLEAEPDRRRRFEELAAEVTEPVRRFLARRTDPETADDVLADTLLVLWRRLDDVPAGGEALPWTYAVARNALANAERGARRQRRLAYRITMTDPPSEAVPDDPEPDDRVSAVLARMRPDEAELLRLWAWEQLGPVEIATVLDLSPNAVSIRLHRARGRFKELFEKGEDPD
jgi:RNA polymerase sigma-70 factor (ECF subfamily)